MQKTSVENIFVKKNYFKIISLIMFFSIIISVPPLVFIYISYANINLKLYFESYSQIQPILSEKLLNPSRIYIFEWVAFTLLMVFLLMMLFVGKLFNNQKISINKKILYISFMLLAQIGWILLISAAQNEYANFQLFFKYQNLTDKYENAPISSENSSAWELMNQIKDQFSINYKNGAIFGWLSNNNVWWMLFAQLSVSIVCFILMQEHLFSKTDFDENIQRIIENNIKKNEFGDSIIKKLYNRLFVVTEKNISLLMIIFSTLLILPQLIYTISISIENGKIASFANWNYLVPRIATDDKHFAEYIVNAKNLPFSYFSLIQLPVISVGLTMSTMIIFVSIYVKRDNTTNALYFAQFAIFIAELFFTIIVAVVSKTQLNSLEKKWNNNDIKSSFFNLYNSFLNTENASGNEKIFHDNFYNLVFGEGSIFGISFIDLSNPNSQVKHLWLNQNQYISESIISFSFAIVATVIIGNKVHKIRKAKTKLESAQKIS